MPNINENEELDFIYEIRVQFDSQGSQSVTRMVEIKNVGTIVFYYEWQQKPYTKLFDIVYSKIQCFYFDNHISSILPRDTLKLSFVFKSSEPEIFTEHWQLLTRSVLCGGRPIIFTLHDVTTEEDVHRQTHINIEKTKEYYCYDIMNQFIDSFVDQMNIIYQKLQIDEPSNESYPDIDLNEKNIISTASDTTKDKKEPPPSKLERGKVSIFLIFIRK
ncbi:unnamed protein product [Rotaria sordida]|uniref:Uncharacterized protein n=1 Tax=Rotaria sordida TaxID=392033 RepID=A0A813RUA5_9BILA|nr:unnamed protein product [Rotaria sordida]